MAATGDTGSGFLIHRLPIRRTGIRAAQILQTTLSPFAALLICFAPLSKMKTSSCPRKIAVAIFSAILTASPALAQTPELKPTGYLADAAEEYWPADSLNRRSPIGKHLPILGGKGFISNGVNVREGFELFKNYLWGIGPQDSNGYLLHRVLVHSELRYKRQLRIFAAGFGPLLSTNVTISPP